MKVAVVEKCIVGRTDSLNNYFDFEYKRFGLTNSNKTKVLKKDITLQLNEDEYDYIVLVGKEPAKHLAGVGNITKMSGQLVNDKYIPLLNPTAINFNPALKTSIESSLTKLHQHIDGSYTENIGKYDGIETKKEAVEWLTKCLTHKSTHVAMDIETSALAPRDGYVLGISISYIEGTGCYINSEVIDEDIEKLIQKIINKKVIVFHNAKFDMKWLEYHFGFIFKRWEDTMLMHYTLNENEAHDLKYLAIKYTKMGEYDKELEDFKAAYCKQHKILKSEFSYELIPFETMYFYAGADTDATVRLYNKFSSLVYKHFGRLYKQLLKRGTQFLKEIEEQGVPFSKKHLDDANISYSNDIIELKQKLYEYPEVVELEEEMGKPFNPNSVVQLRELFFKKLKLHSTKKTAKGELSTDKEVLEALAKKHPIPNLVLDIRHKVKMQSTYITKVIKGLDSDSRLRTGFHLHTVTSGRLSSSGKLNMQQLPRDDKTIKDAIRSTIPDYKIFSQDLQTAEMYYAAALSGDRNLAKVFIDGGDFHSSIAKLTFNLPCKVEEVAKKYPLLRQGAKAVSFGIMYGAGPAKVAATAGISTKEAKDIIDKYFEQFYRLKQWIGEIQDEIKTNGYIYSAFGRKRRVANVFSVDEYEQGHAVRSAMNFTVQSVASDVNLLAAIDAHDMFKKEKIPAKIFALVHDSILGEYHKDAESEVEEILRICTQKDRGVGIKNCPIKVDFATGDSYAQAE